MVFARSSLRTAILSAFVLASFSQHAQATIARSVPAGFEDILSGQTEEVDVNLFGRSLGMFQAYVKPDTIRMLDPEAVVSALELGQDENSGLVSDIVHALSVELPRNGQLAGPGQDSAASGYVETDSAAIVFDESQATVNLFLAREWLEHIPKVKQSAKHYHRVSSRAENAFVHKQSILWSTGSQQQKTLSLKGVAALGLTERGYLGGDWQFDTSSSRRRSSSDFDINSLYLRQDVGEKYYGQIGRLDQRNLASALGGNFNFTLLPLPRFDGARVGTTQAYVNSSVSSNATPVTVLLTGSARVDVYRGAQLLGTQYFNAGIQSLDTSAFPEGSYVLQLRIFESGIHTRTEDVPFGKTGSSMGSLDTQWFLQGGKIVQDGQPGRGTGGHSVQAGFKTGILDTVLLTSGLSTMSGAFFNETRLDWQKAIFNGTLSASAAFFAGSDGTRGNTQSLSYSNSVGLSVYRYQIRSPEHRPGTSSIVSHGNYDSIYASVYAPLGKWSLNAGMNYSKSKGRRLFGGAFDRDGFGTQDSPSYPSRRSGDSVTRAVQLGASRTFRWSGMQFNTRVGAYQSSAGRGSGRGDRGVYAGVTISSQAPASVTGRSSFSSAGVDVRSSRTGQAQINYNAGQTWAWQNGTYRELGVDVSGYRDERFNGLMRGQIAGRAGTLNGALSHSRQLGHGDQSSAFTGGYVSSLAISKSGAYWGGDTGSSDPGAAMAVKVADGDDQEQSAVTEIVGSAGRNFSLGFGQSALIPADGYREGQIEIRDATSAKSQGVASLTRGAGNREYFLTPGKLLTQDVTADITYTYLGRALGTNGIPLVGAKILNVPAAELDEEGGFVMDVSGRLNTLYLLDGEHLMQCPMIVQGKRAVVQFVGEATCTPIALSALPHDLRQQSRVSRLLGLPLSSPLALRSLDRPTSGVKANESGRYGG